MITLIITVALLVILYSEHGFNGKRIKDLKKENRRLNECLEAQDVRIEKLTQTIIDNMDYHLTKINTLTNQIQEDDERNQKIVNDLEQENLYLQYQLEFRDMEKL